MKKFALLLMFVSFTASAFTETEKTQLRTAAQAEPTIATCISQGNDVCVADWFNATSTFTAWRTNVPVSEYYNSAIVWTAVDGLAVGKARIWEWMSMLETLNPSKLNVRQGFADAFGAASATTVAATALSKRFASNAEKTLATGTGTVATPGFFTWEGTININDVSAIMRP